MEISKQEVLIIKALMRSGWMSNRDIAMATGVPARTVRSHTAKLLRLGVLDCAAVFPGYRYRINPYESRYKQVYLDLFTRAANAFGVPL